jgi:cyclophilin family peptidyl-prolyl cis-trans isomerase
MRRNDAAVLGGVLALLLLGCSREAPEAAPAQQAVAPPSEEQPVAASDTLDLPATNYYEISTPLGRMVVRLYDETPVHRDNFKKLAAEGFYDGTLFHRVIAGFMIQGGDPNSRDDDPYDDGSGGPGYTLPAEFRPQLFHKRGALAAARKGDHVNPERRSSGSQFYIVQGTPLDSLTLDAVQEQIRFATQEAGFTFAPEVRRAYQTEGGAPNLDQQYTVFGEVVEGLDVLDQIAAVDTPNRRQERVPPPLADRPLQPIPMQIRPLPGYPEAG